jgi:hypothetical protein
MDIWIYVYVYVYIYICIYVYIYVYTHTHTHTYTYAYAYTYTYIHTYPHMYASMPLRRQLLLPQEYRREREAYKDKERGYLGTNLAVFAGGCAGGG